MDRRLHTVIALGLIGWLGGNPTFAQGISRTELQERVKAHINERMYDFCRSVMLTERPDGTYEGFALLLNGVQTGLEVRISGQDIAYSFTKLKPPVERAEQPVQIVARVHDVRRGERRIGLLARGLLGVSAAELQRLGLNLNANLDPGMLQRLQSKDIQNLELNMKPSGLTIYVNGNPLPVLAWDEKSLGNAVDLYSRYDKTNQLMPLVQQLLPVLSNPDIAVLLHLPPREGAKLIPAQMH